MLAFQRFNDFPSSCIGDIIAQIKAQVSHLEQRERLEVFIWFYLSMTNQFKLSDQIKQQNLTEKAKFNFVHVLPAEREALLRFSRVLFSELGTLKSAQILGLVESHTAFELCDQTVQHVDLKEQAIFAQKDLSLQLEQWTETPEELERTITNVFKPVYSAIYPNERVPQQMELAKRALLMAHNLIKDHKKKTKKRPILTLINLNSA